MRFVTLDYIVRDLCIINLNDATLRRYNAAARAVRSALAQLHYHILPAIRSCVVEIGENYTAPLPEDLIAISKVGAISNGRFIQLLTDENLRRFMDERLNGEDECCECDATDVPENADATNVFHNVEWQGNYYGELYTASRPLDRAGTYRFNRERHVLEFGAGGYINVGQEIVIEYKSVLQATDYELIPAHYQQAIRAYAMYELSGMTSQVHMMEFRRLMTQAKRVDRYKDIVDHLNSHFKYLTNAPR